MVRRTLGAMGSEFTYLNSVLVALHLSPSRSALNDQRLSCLQHDVQPPVPHSQCFRSHPDKRHMRFYCNVLSPRGDLDMKGACKAMSS